MTASRSLLCVLALLVALPAEAAFIRRSKIKETISPSSGASSYRVTAVVSDDSATSTVEATVESDAGEEALPLEESDAWLHGAAPIAALPAMDARLTLTLYDDASAALMSFSGTLGTDGSVTLIADATKDIDSGACEARVGCTDDTGDTSTTTPDIELLGSELFAASAGYELGVDLAGADTYGVAYAELSVTESDEVTTCSKETGECTTTGSSTTVSAEVGWDEIGSVWEAELATAPEGLLEVKVKAYDAAGRKLETAKMKLGVPWRDGGEGVNTLATDDDPLTTVALLRPPRWYHVAVSHGLVVSSEGWTTTSYPTHAEVQLTGGTTVNVPAHSYQRDKSLGYSEEGIYVEGLENVKVAVTGGSIVLSEYSALELLTPVCSSDTCVVLVEAGDGYAFSFTTYGASPAELAETQDFDVALYDSSGEVLYADTLAVEFDSDVTAVFANEIGFAEDPSGLDLSGKVSLLAAADRKGKQKTLAKGKFYGTFSRDADGDVELAGADKDEVASLGDIVVAGEAIGLGDDEGSLDTPPVLLYSNGSVTRTSCMMEKLDLEVDVDVK